MKLNFTLLLVLLGYFGFAQCVPDSLITGPGIYPDNDSIPCIVQGQQYNASLTFEIDTNEDNGYPTDSVTILAITNLPCGISWSANNSYYNNGQPGCIQLSGTTNDTVNQYQVQVVLEDVMFTYIAGDAIPVETDTLIFTKYLRVKYIFGACLPVDTTNFGASSCNSAIIPPPPPPPPTPLTVSISGNLNACAGISSRLTVNTQGGVGINHYRWSNGDTTSSIVVLADNTAYVTVSDDSFTVIDSAFVKSTKLEMTVQTIQAFSCTGGGGVADVNINVGTNPFIYRWSNGESTELVQGLVPGDYIVTVTDGAGCVARDSFIINGPCYDVWPGDADDNGTVDYNDILRIAYSYNNTGPVRPDASLQWKAQAAPIWYTSAISGNDKYADCDGNGVINAEDTLAVALNYTLAHGKNAVANQAKTTDPVLQLIPVNDSLYPNSTFNLQILLGSSILPVDSLYGLAFAVNIDPTIFDTTIASITTSNSWMGNNLLTFRKMLPGQNQVILVLSRTDFQNASGNGEIGTLTLKTLNQFPANVPAIYSLTPVYLTGATAIDSPVAFNIQSNTVTVATGITTISIDQNISLSPNPNNGHFTLTINQPSRLLNVELLDINGSNLYNEQFDNVASLNKEFDFSSLAKGIYLLRVITENGLAVKRVVIE